jgi:hypothetical protein
MVYQWYDTYITFLTWNNLTLKFQHKCLSIFWNFFGFSVCAVFLLLCVIYYFTTNQWYK